MSEAVVRFFIEPRVRLFRLSPLYAEPGWYGRVDAGRTIGPYPTVEQVIEQAEALLAGRERTAADT